MTKSLSETWTGEGLLAGAASISFKAHPQGVTFRYPETHDRVVVKVHAPAIVPGQLNQFRWMQRLEVEVFAPESRALYAAEEVLSQLADFCSFAGSCPVAVTLSALGTIRQSRPVSLLKMVRMRGQERACLVTGEQIAYLGQKVGDSGSSRSRKLVRALRWLNKSLTEEGVIEEFAALAYGMEAVASLLPTSALTEERSAAAAGGASDGAKRLREWATATMGLSGAEWKRVGASRNELFHGGLMRSATGDLELARDCANLRYALVGALKHLLGLASTDSPTNSRQRVVAQGLSIVTPGRLSAAQAQHAPLARGAKSSRTQSDPGRAPWPRAAIDQLVAVMAAVEQVGSDAEAIIATFDGADAALVRRHLETFRMTEEV